MKELTLKQAAEDCRGTLTPEQADLVHRFFILYSFLRILSLFVWQNITKK